MAAFKALLLALFAVACVMAEEAPREKKAVVGAYPYAYHYANDDGSYWPGKYEGTGLPAVTSYAAPAVASYAAPAVTSYAAPAYSGYAYHGYPYYNGAYRYY